MPPIYDKHLLAACTDVVIRYKGHGSYGSEARALDALARRAPGFGPRDYESVFRLLVRVYERAVSAVARYRRDPRPGQHAEPEHVDTAACLRSLNRISPGYARREKARILDWVIFWHHMK